jgi:uncharacterized protein (DUF2147 family)
MRRAAALVVLATIAGIQPGFASPLGFWRAHDGAVIQIKPCGHDLCGFVVSTDPNPGTGKPDYSDRYNEDADKRSRSRIGIEVLIAMKPNGRSKWSGQLYSDRNGHTYSGDLIELNPSQIEVDGCWLLFCGGETLNRKK